MISVNFIFESVGHNSLRFASVLVVKGFCGHGYRCPNTLEALRHDTSTMTYMSALVGIHPHQTTTSEHALPLTKRHE
jgi:hypothetical protein